MSRPIGRTPRGRASCHTRSNAVGSQDPQSPQQAPEEPAKAKRALQKILDGREQEGCARKRSAPWSKIGQDGKAVEYLLKDCEALLAFSDFPAGHLEISAHEQRHRKFARNHSLAKTRVRTH